MSFDTQIDNYLKIIKEKYTNELMDLVAIPSISCKSDHQVHLDAIAKKASDMLTEIGFESQVIETKGGPCVLGKLHSDKNAPWVTVYNHMDVQPADEDAWINDPFVPILKDDVVLGRGSTDDKGPALSIMHAIKFLKENNHKLPNIQVIYETEEEIGSTHFHEFMMENKDIIEDSASVLISDTIFEGDNPAITYKLKGMQRIDISLKTGTKDLHSGIFGNGIQNPLTVLTNALASCVNAKGEVLVDGFYENTKVMGEQELVELQKVADVFDIEKFKRDSANGSLNFDDPKDILLGIWHKSTFELHGFEGIQTNPGEIKSALPYNVIAKVSMRLIGGQDPKDIVEKVRKHVQKIDPKIEVIDRGGIRAVATEFDHPIMEVAKDACKYGFGSDALFVGCGGSIGSIPVFQEVFEGAPIVLIAQSLMSDGYHAPNEQFSIKQGLRGIKTMANYLTNLADFKS
ncbi:MAG: M20/M25/M40 family metallo-hydrolase [Candidatus Cloacimonetes bacterium]|nr:M20/M25/M40 family metallo-hydrolase [Candidatus Cloacimonadota bacterium]